MKLRGLFLLPGVALVLVVALTVVVAHAANMAVSGGSLGLANQASAAQQFEPAACTGAVTAIVVVPSSGGLFIVSTADNLIVGTSSNDNVKATRGYNCFVGGGPSSSNKDKFTGPAGAGDQCIVASSDAAGNVNNCSIVQRSP
jgi:hypothetical protein